MNEDPKFIAVTAREDSEVTAKPHKALINIAHIIGVEQIMYQYVKSEDEIAWREGTSITVTNCPQFDVREPFDVICVMLQLKMADDDWEKLGVFQQNLLKAWWELQDIEHNEADSRARKEMAKD